MNLIRTRHIEANRLHHKQKRGIGCQRCQDRNEYLMVFDLPNERCIWVCPSCHFELSRANKVKS